MKRLLPLASDASNTNAARVVAIDKTGVLFRTGWPVRHDADRENIAVALLRDFPLGTMMPIK